MVDHDHAVAAIEQQVLHGAAQHVVGPVAVRCRAAQFDCLGTHEHTGRIADGKVTHGIACQDESVVRIDFDLLLVLPRNATAPAIGVPDEAGNERRLRIVVERLRGPNLFEVAVLHDRDLVGHDQCF